MEENIKITAANMSELVQKAFKECLFKEGEDFSTHVKVEGLRYTFALHPQRLEAQREVVTALLAELPAEFKAGYTFLNLCQNKNGELWTGMHRICEQLVIMAIGLGLMEYTYSKKIWPSLPGKVPYITVK